MGVLERSFNKVYNKNNHFTIKQLFHPNFGMLLEDFLNISSKRLSNTEILLAPEMLPWILQEKFVVRGKIRGSFNKSVEKDRKKQNFKFGNKKKVTGGQIG